MITWSPWTGNRTSDLICVTRLVFAASQADALGGARSLKRQKRLKAVGATKVFNSRHITLHAVDLVPLIDGKARCDWPLYRKLALFICAAARAEHISLEWGGDWKFLS
jgi:peptidoglycan L-alanyl-D-glutamate endopeptidase CwlK